MNEISLKNPFRDALREQLVHGATATKETRRPHRRVITTLLLGMALAGGGGAAVAGGLWALPGGENEYELGAPVTLQAAGTATLALPPAPEAATKVRVDLSCRSAGSFTLPSNAGSFTCSSEDVGTAAGVASTDYALADVGDSLTVATSETATWALTAAYIRTEIVPLATNANGDTFGVIQTNGQNPDLIAVIASNGQQGYVYTDDLAAADGTGNALGSLNPGDALVRQAGRDGRGISVPVFDSTGETEIGVFIVG